MKIATLCIAAAAAMTLQAAPVAAQDISGSWELSMEGPRGNQTMEVMLVHEGSELTGTLTMRMGGARAGGRRGGGGGGGGGAREIEISEGSVDGDAFTFTMTLEMRGNSFTQVFSGTFDGDSMEGQVEGGRGGSRPFSGKRSS